DDVARHLRAAAGELGHLPGRADAPPAGREPGPERVGDEGERLLLADRARLVDDPADTLGRPAQLGVGVADVDPRQAALAVLAHDRLARQPVVDDAAVAVHGTERLRAEAHGERG